MIEFNHPRIESTVEQFDHLYKLMDRSSNLVGFLISLGKKFISCKTEDLDKKILPKIQACLEGSVISRVYIGYGVLMWFVLKVRN